MSAPRRLIASALIVAALALLGLGAFWFTRVNFSLTDGRALRAAPSDAPVRQTLWDPPKALAHWPLSESTDEYEPHISADGATLLLVRNRAGANADIYIARRSPDGWSEPQPLDAVNTSADELAPEISPDGRTLYFSSDRESPDSLGGFDLYASRLHDGEWTEPENLGIGVNSPWNEHDPALTPDAERLYFSSNRPRDGEAPSADGRAWPATIRQDTRAHDYDLYQAQRSDLNAWRAAPLTTVNTPHNDGAAAVSPAGDFLYFASDRPRGRGGLDIYRLRIEPPGPWPVENLGAPVNTPANELDPALTAHGFALQFSSDRIAAPEDDRPERYALYESISREVYRDMDLKPIDWASLWSIIAPWLMWLLLALLLALLLLLLARLLSDARWKARWRALSLLARCLILSALVHLLLLALFTIWQVSSAITSLLDGRGQTQIAFISSDSGAGVESQLLAPMTDVQSPVIETQREQADPTIPTIQNAPEPLRAPLAERDAAPDTLDLTIDTTESAVAMTTPTVDAQATPPAQPDLSTPLSQQQTATTEALSEPLAIDSTHQSAPVLATISPAPAPTRFDAAVESVPPPLEQPESLEVPAAAAPTTSPTLAAQPPITTTASLDVSLPAQRDAQPMVNEPAEPSITGAIAAPTRATPQVATSTATQSSLTLPPAEVQSSEPHAHSAPTASLSAPPVAPTLASSTPTPTAAAPDISLPLAPARAAQAEIPEAQLAATTVPTTRAEPRAAPVIPSASPPMARVATAPESIAPSESPASAARDVPIPSVASATPATRPAPPPSAIARAPLDSLALPSDTDARPRSASAEPARSQPALPMPSPSRPSIVPPGNPGAAPARLALAPSAVASPDMRTSPPLASNTSMRAPSLPPVAAPRVAIETPHLPLDLPIPSDPAPTMYPQRAPEARQALVEKGGGGRETEEAVQRALAWLARAQLPDGSWNGRRFDHACADCGGHASYEFQSAMTGLALLCFLGADNTHTREGEYQDTVRRGIDFLVSRQSSSGDLRAGETLYSHGIASIALAEAYGMTRDPELRDPVQRAIDFIAASRSRREGGWRYEPRQAGDTSVLGWQIMALESARRCGVNVPADAINEARAWLARVTSADTPGLYSYQPFGPPTESMTAEGLFVRQLVSAGQRVDDANSRASVHYIMRHMPRWQGGSSAGATYYWYYATLALYQHPGEEWGRWNRALMPILLERQRADGDAAGSWDPSDRWSEIGGRIYQTAICTLMLEVYYRYLPTYLTADRPEAPANP